VGVAVGAHQRRDLARSVDISRLEEIDIVVRTERGVAAELFDVGAALPYVLHRLSLEILE